MRIKNGKIVRAQKCVMYGCEGIGKTTFASKFPKPLFIDLEGGSAHLDVNRVEDVDSWEGLLGVIGELIDDRQGFETFVLDTADWAERLCVNHICAKYKKLGIEDFGYGKGYQYLGEEYAKMLLKLTELQNLGMHILVLAHSTIKKLELPEETGSYDHYELKCTKTVSPLLKEWSDALLFLNFRTIVQTSTDGKSKAIGGRERVVYTTHTAFCDAKNRWGLQDILKLTWGEFAEIFCAAREEQEEETKEPKKSKTPLERLTTTMELSGVSPDELNAFLCGKNAKNKAHITAEQTYENLNSATIDRLLEEKVWESVESFIKSGRAK